MTEPKSINRLETTDDDRLRVVSKGFSSFYSYPDGRRSVLTQEYEDLFVSLFPKKGGPELVRIGTAAHPDGVDGWFLHGANGIYAEVSIEERELTDAEVAWCDAGVRYNDAETVVEFEIPHPEDLRSAILDQDTDRFDCLDAVIEDHDTRHDVLTELQERIATEDVRANQLHPREGLAVDLLPEWDPDDSHNDGKTREHLYDMASMRTDAHQYDFKNVAGFAYPCFRNARARVLGIYESDLDLYDLCQLDVAGYPEWTYCQRCAAVGPEEEFIIVDLDLGDIDRHRRVCDRCADVQVEFEHCRGWTEAAVAKARDKRAKEQGHGQRRLEAEYGGEDGAE